MVTVRLSWYERFLNNLNNTNLYVGKGKRYKPEREEALKDFLREMEKECWEQGYAAAAEHYNHYNGCGYF